MTITCNVNTVASSLAGLTISGVTVKDIDEIPDTARMLAPILIPATDYMSGTRMSFETFGSNGTAKVNMEYDLNYMFLYSEVGGINAFAPFSPLMTKLALVLETIMSNDKINGLVDMKLNSVSNVGIITDPAGVQFWGVQISLHVLEYSQ